VRFWVEGVGIVGETPYASTASFDWNGQGVIELGTHRYRSQVVAGDVPATDWDLPAIVEVDLVPPLPLGAPYALAATQLSATSVRLSWHDNSTQEKFFVVERKTGSANFALAARVGANVTTATVTGLKRGKTYQLRVGAKPAKGATAYSAPITYTVP
jgi:hypothetical protein